MSRSIRLAVIPGDGIGPEVVAEALHVAETMAPAYDVKFETTHYDLGARRWRETGEVLPDSVLAEIRGHDAILLGAVGDPSLPSGLLERGLLLRLRFELDQHVNLRPVRLYEGVETPLAGAQPADIDMLVVREGTEGPYAGAGGTLRRGTPYEVATQESLNTAYGVERLVRYAFQRATARPRKQLTLVHKTNVLTYAGELWTRTVDAVATDFPDVTVDYVHVDAATMYFVTQPERFDVVVTDNLFGDIITDLGAAVAGGIGLAASGNINPADPASSTAGMSGAPSMFEPVHGSAPDIAGQGVADPTATILSVVMLLEHIGATRAAHDLEQAVATDLWDRQQLSAQRSTREVAANVLRRVSR